MKKIGLLCLALVLALGTLGVGYAMWSDEVIIEGTVDTGTLRIGIIKAEAELYQDKPVATVELSFEDEIGPWDCDSPPGAEDSAYGKLVVTLNNTFPCLEVDIEFYVGGMGTIPIHITGINMTDPTGELTSEWDPAHLPGTTSNPKGYFYLTNDPEKEHVINFEVINLICSQLHQCTPDKADLILHVKQPAEQDHTYKFEFKVIGQQWAKSPG